LKGENIPQNLIAEFKNEAALLASLNHPNIVHLYGICTDMPDSPFSLILEFASGGGLDGKLRDTDYIPKTEMPSLEIRQRLAFDIARGVAYLHKHKIVHGDLRACNILVDKNNNAKLGDFGLAKQRVANMSMVMTNERTHGFFNWLSPELLKTGKKTEASDVYSFGMILWELMTGKIPFDGYDEETIGNVISLGDVLSYHPIPSDAPNVLANLMKKCLSRIPEDRPKMHEVVEMLFKALEPEEYKAYHKAKPSESESIPIIGILYDEKNYY